MDSSSPAENAYCTKLGIPVPRLEELVYRTDLKLFHLMIVALLERGGPMSLNEIAERLEAVGLEVATGDMTLSLKKAWHGLKPVYQGPDGRYALLLDSPEMSSQIFRMELRNTRRTEPPESAPVPPGPNEPITDEELQAALGQRQPSGLSALRATAALLDATGRSMAPDEADRLLCALTGCRNFVSEDTLRYWKSNATLITFGEDGALTLNRESRELPMMRLAVRNVARFVLHQQREKANWEKRKAEIQAREAEEKPKREQEAAALRRAILHAVPEDDPLVFVLLDMNARTLRTFFGENVSALVEALAGFDLLAGLGIRELLYHLGLDLERWRLADLTPPKKKHRLNRQGRTLSITPELVISGTTGISRPLGDPGKVAEYLQRGERRKLAARIESDAKALYAYYRYGLLQHFVRLRWGFVDETLFVDWPQPGDVNAYQLLEQARNANVPVDLVLRTAPGWTDPWSRARRFHLIDVQPWWITVREGETESQISRMDIQAIRLAPQETNTTTP